MRLSCFSTPFFRIFTIMTILFDGVESNLPFVSGFSTISSKALTYPLFGVDEDMEGMVGTPTHGVVCVDKGVVPTNTGDGASLGRVWPTRLFWCLVSTLCLTWPLDAQICSNITFNCMYTSKRPSGPTWFPISTFFDFSCDLFLRVSYASSFVG